jgi:protein-tyrosine-phosphatase
MGCYIAEFTPTAFGGDSRRWELTDPAGRDIETVRRVREQLDARVYALLDEIEREVTARV